MDIYLLPAGRKGMEAEVKYGKSVYHALTMITQFGINMLVPIFLCSFLGIYLAGFRNVYIFAKRIYSMKNERDTKRGRKTGGSDGK